MRLEDAYFRDSGNIVLEGLSAIETLPDNPYADGAKFEVISYERDWHALSPIDDKRHEKIKRPKDSLVVVSRNIGVSFEYKGICYTVYRERVYNLSRDRDIMVSRAGKSAERLKGMTLIILNQFFNQGWARRSK